MVKGFKVLLLVAASAVSIYATSSVMAAIAIPNAWYIEGNAGTSRISNTNYGSSGLSNSNNGFGWNINGGYKFMPYFAAELGYTNYAKTKVKFNGAGIANNTHFSYYLAGKGILP